MPDFHQPGPVLTLPLLSTEREERLETDLTKWTQERPLALVLPCHTRDLEGDALAGIIETLTDIPWISRVVAGLDGADRNQYEKAARKFRRLKMPCDVLHHDITAAPPGKGRNLRNCADHLKRCGGVFAVAMHDCDVRTYSRSFLARLCWPVMHPEACIRACKGYYARNAGRLHGRVFRLMFQPLLRAWADLVGEHPWPAFLQSLRYPLSGELCVEAALLEQLPFDEGWGVEVSFLHGLYLHAGPGAICQAELCPAYDHRHHDAAILEEMAGEVAAALALTMKTEDAIPAGFDMGRLLNRYESLAGEAVMESSLSAQINGLDHDIRSEMDLAAGLARAVRNQLMSR